MTVLLRAIATVALLALFVGCHGTGLRYTPCRKVTASPTVSPLAVVDVGGLVAQPQRLEVQPQGLSLRRALALAGQLSAPAAVQPNNQAVPPQILDLLIENSKNLGQVQLQQDLNGFAKVAAADFGMTNDQLDTAQTNSFNAVKNLMQQLTPAQQSLVGQLRINESAQDLGWIEQKVTLRTAHPEWNWSRVGNSQARLEDDKAQVDKATSELDKSKKTATANASFNAGAASVISTPINTHLVAMQRQLSSQPETYYFPYDTATTTQVGEIALLAGDLIQVLDFQRTQLAIGDNSNPLGGAGGTVFIQGLVQRPGSTIFSGSISMLLQKAGVGTNDNSAVVTIDRTSAIGNGREVFVIPLALARSGALSNLAMQGGDVCTVTTMPRVPIVMHGLLTQVLRTNTLTSNQFVNPGCLQQAPPGSLPDCYQKQMQECIGKSDDVTAQALRNLQGACKATKLRVGEAVNVP